MVTAYNKYKNSGLPWVGEIPEHWNILRAKTLFRKIERPVRDFDEVVTCFRDGTVTLRKNRRVRGFTESLKEIGYQGIRKGDLVIHMMDAFAGAIGVSDSDGKGTPVYLVCEPSEDIDVNYFVFLLREMARSKWILALAKGIRERSTDFRFVEFASQFYPVPPIQEQRSISTFLNNIDAIIRRYIRTKKKAVEFLAEQKQSIIHRAITRGVDSNGSLKSSGIPWIGNIPVHWKVLPIGRILTERNEKNNPIKTNNILSLSLHDGVIPYADKRPGGNKAKEDLSAYKLAYPGDIVLNSMNVVVGSVGLSKYFGAVSPVYYMLNPRRSEDVIEYFNAVFQDKTFQSSLFGLGNGIMVIQSRSTGKLNTIRMRIPMNKLNRVCVPYPSPEEQKAIVNYIESATAPIDNVTNRILNELDILQEYRTRLITDVVTGKRDIRDYQLPDLKDDNLTEPVDEQEMLEDDEDTEEVVNADE